MDGRERNMERVNMDENNNTKEIPKRKTDTNQPPDLITLAPGYVNGVRRSRAKR